MGREKKAREINITYNKVNDLSNWKEIAADYKNAHSGAERQKVHEKYPEFYNMYNNSSARNKKIERMVKRLDLEIDAEKTASEEDLLVQLPRSAGGGSHDPDVGRLVDVQTYQDVLEMFATKQNLKCQVVIDKYSHYLGEAITQNLVLPVSADVLKKYGDKVVTYQAIFDRWQTMIPETRKSTVRRFFERWLFPSACSREHGYTHPVELPELRVGSLLQRHNKFVALMKLEATSKVSTTTKVSATLKVTTTTPSSPISPGSALAISLGAAFCAVPEELCHAQTEEPPPSGTPGSAVRKKMEVNSTSHFRFVF